MKIKNIFHINCVKLEVKFPQNLNNAKKRKTSFFTIGMVIALVVCNLFYFYLLYWKLAKTLLPVPLSKSLFMTDVPLVQ